MDEALTPGPFLRSSRLPAGRPAMRRARDLRAHDGRRRSAGARVAIEQFDASATRPLVGFGDGWHEQEFNPRTGLRWRWLSERGELRRREARTGR